MNFRSSIDTLYVGLLVDDLLINEEVEKIKKNLSFLKNEKWNTEFCRNRFYRFELVSEQNGFFLFGSPRGKTRNASLTLQLGGLFFRRPDSQKFINFLFNEFFGMIDFQRIDVCLDIIYGFEDLKKIDYDKDTGVLGFPFPSYSESWKNRKIDFEVYSRNRDNNTVVNMVSQGKDDFRMRVYDKSLELQEKHKVEYKFWYELSDIDCAQVYRIEIQLRGDKLKSFVSQCDLKENTMFCNYEHCVFNCLSYLFYKYDFRYLDKEKFMLENFSCSLNHTVESTLEGRMKYARMMYNKWYVEYCRLWNEYQEFCADEIRLDEKLKIFAPPVSPINDDLKNVDFYDFMYKQKDLPFD